MSQLLAWLSLVVLVALPQPTTIKDLPTATTAARISQLPATGAAPAQRAADPIEVGDDGDGVDGDGHAVDPGAVLAAQLRPETPRSAVARPSGARAGVLESLATQECGPPRA